MDGFQTVERDAMRIRPEFPNRFAQRFKIGHWCDWCVHNLWMSWLRFERVVLQDVALTVARLSRDRVASRLASRTLLLRMLPRIDYHPSLPRRCQPCCEAAANRAANRKKLASMVALLACRGGVRTFAAACGWRSSLACFLGALAAAPGSVAMLAHRRIAFRAALARWRFRFQAGVEFFPFALESSFSRWRCAVRVNGMENFLLVAA